MSPQEKRNQESKLITPKLTQYSPGAGCGCKIAPKELEKIVSHTQTQFTNEKLLVGNSTKDDAAVYDLGNGKALISTTDFFTPIVDDPYDFGRIAATNAISDIYAMGGSPIMALAILSWPLNTLPIEAAQKVIEGAQTVCNSCKVSLSGGHSIDTSIPIFGLSVNGLADIVHIKQNNTATSNCILILTKPLGIGIFTTAEKKGLVTKQENSHIVELMCKPNQVGQELAKIKAVKSMTDITGFGLLGHLSEICEGSHVDAIIHFDKIPKIDGVFELIEKGAVPGGTMRNWNSYKHKVHSITEKQKNLLCDPQTSGGLLLAIEERHVREVAGILQKHQLPYNVIGKLIDRKDPSAPYVQVVS